MFANCMNTSKKLKFWEKGLVLVLEHVRKMKI